MPTLGIHALCLSPSWETDALARAILAAARLGYDLIELPLADPRRLDPAPLRAALTEAGIVASCSVLPPRRTHLPWFPEHARSWLGRALDVAEAIGARTLVGALAYAPGVFSGEGVTLAERFVIAEVLQDLGDEAQHRGIALSLMPANRYETYVANTLADGLDLVQGVDNDALRLHAHTFHMGIEEGDLAAALAQAGASLGYVTVSESHRGRLGAGLMPWGEIWRGLAAANYAGPLVLESFGEVGPEATARLALWRGEGTPGEAAARAGLAFLRAGVATMARSEAPPTPSPTKPRPPSPRKRTPGKSYRPR